MLLIIRPSPEVFGELIRWDENSNAFELLISGTVMYPGQGLIVLEIQQRVFHYLVDYCERIMYDIPADHLASDRYPIQPLVKPAKETVNSFDSLVIMAAEAPYRLPANMGLVRLESLIAAKKGATGDHI